MIREYKSEILNIRNISYDLKEMELSKPDEFDFRAGQYFSINIYDENGRKIRRPYSIASTPSEKTLKICFKNVGGLASKYLFSLKEGDSVEFMGPMGIFEIYKNSLKNDIIFIASGTGIAPFRSMIKYLLDNNFQHKIILIRSARSEDKLLYKEDFEQWDKQHENFKQHVILSQPNEKSFENTGYIQNFVQKFIPSKFGGTFYMCGLKDMIVSTTKKLEEAHIPKDFIFYESYD